MGIVESTYAELKQQELKNNPYSCLHMADIDINPHQIEAFTFALSSLELGGAILADEVGLGKTIEAGLVIKYLLCSGKNKILLIMPSNLRKQWQVELEEKFDMKLKDGIKLHERRKSIVYKYCIDNQLEQVKPIVLIACKDTTHARKIKEKIDSYVFFGGRYVGKVIEIDSSTSGAETEENIQKLLTIEKNTNPIEIVLHVYKLKEGWDVNNLFTIIPLNAAKSDILALQTIGRGLRLPFGEITGIEELDTLDIVAHDHYREIVDDIKNNPVFKKRNLDEEDIPNTKTVMVEPAVENQQISLFDEALCESKVKSYQDLNNENVVENLFAEYQKAFVKKVAPKKSESDSGQMSIFDYFANDDEKETNDGTASEHKMTQTGMLDMFNKRNKSEITEQQHRKIRGLIAYSIKPFLRERLKYK